MKAAARLALLCIILFAVTAVGLYLIMRTGSVCPTAGFFGIPCPFCGLTRAVIFALDGNYAASFESNPMLVPVLFGMLIAADWFSRELDMRYRGRRYTRTFHIWAIAVIFIAVFAVYFYRLPNFLV